VHHCDQLHQLLQSLEALAATSNDLFTWLKRFAQVAVTFAAGGCPTSFSSYYVAVRLSNMLLKPKHFFAQTSGFCITE
jgi:hypothetical protein